MNTLTIRKNYLKLAIDRLVKNQIMIKKINEDGLRNKICKNTLITNEMILYDLSDQKYQVKF